MTTRPSKPWRSACWTPTAGPQFVVQEFGPRDFGVYDNATGLSNRFFFTRKAAQEASDSLNASATQETP